MKNSRLLTGITGTALAFLIMANPAFAEESQPASTLDKNKIISFAQEGSLPELAVGAKNVEQTKVAEKKKERELPVSTFNMIPVEFEEVENLESVTGFNPVHFPSTDLSKIVQDWKIVGEQYLREEADLQSDVVRILKENQEIEVIDKENTDWYKVKIKDKVEVKHEGKKKEEVKETIGYISSEYIQLIDEEKEKEIEEKVVIETKKVEKELKKEIEKELKEEAEKKRLEEERIAKEKAEAEKLEQERIAQEKAEQERIAAEKEVQRIISEKEKQAKQAAELQAEKERIAKSVKQSAAKKATVSKVSSAKSTTVQSTTATSQPKAAEKRVAAPSGSSNVLANGAKYIGASYVFGASASRTDAFDCSSFTQRVFAEAGISLPRNSAAQAGRGTTVSKENLQPGDLVFFNTSGSGISHVGIYAGNGQFLGAQSSTGVAYASMNSSYWGPKYVTAKRVR